MAQSNKNIANADALTSVRERNIAKENGETQENINDDNMQGLDAQKSSEKKMLFSHRTAVMSRLKNVKKIGLEFQKYVDMGSWPKSPRKGVHPIVGGKEISKRRNSVHSPQHAKARPPEGAGVGSDCGSARAQVFSSLVHVPGQGGQEQPTRAPHLESVTGIQATIQDRPRRKTHTRKVTILGEIPLIICPVKNCPTHTNGTKNDSYVAKSNTKNNDNNSTEQNNDSHNTKEKAPEKTSSNQNKNKPDNFQNKKRSGQENFQTPTKFARKIIEIPIEKVVCTTQNKFAILEDEEGMDTSTPTPRIKPIMMKINKNYNLILQEINRTYPNTVNKNTGNYIKIQPATAEDDENIKKLLVIKKADHYTVEHPTVIKAVIKGLPSSTNVTDIETELKAKGFDVEKIAQLRKFSTKSPLPLFMIQIKRSENAQDIFQLKNLIYLTVE
ncbi:uncharacterized protein TNCV_609261 [Trichonephila clavipes]|nr:uncharacterized protein TNCV_609261 [Trichonephila clavipes]